MAYERRGTKLVLGIDTLTLKYPDLVVASKAYNEAQDGDIIDLHYFHVGGKVSSFPFLMVPGYKATHDRLWILDKSISFTNGTINLPDGYGLLIQGARVLFKNVTIAGRGVAWHRRIDPYLIRVAAGAQCVFEECIIECESRSESQAILVEEQATCEITHSRVFGSQTGSHALKISGGSAVIRKRSLVQGGVMVTAPQPDLQAERRARDAAPPAPPTQPPLTGEPSATAQQEQEHGEGHAGEGVQGEGSVQGQGEPAAEAAGADGHEGYAAGPAEPRVQGEGSAAWEGHAADGHGQGQVEAAGPAHAQWQDGAQGDGAQEGAEASQGEEASYGQEPQGEGYAAGGEEAGPEGEAGPEQAEYGADGVTAVGGTAGGSTAASSLEIKNSEIRLGSVTCVSVCGRGSRIYAEGSSVAGSTNFGITASHGAQVELEKCEVEGASVAGVVVTGGAQLVASGSRLQGGLLGVEVKRGGIAQLTRCTLVTDKGRSDAHALPPPPKPGFMPSLQVVPGVGQVAGVGSVMRLVDCKFGKDGLAPPPRAVTGGAVVREEGVVDAMGALGGVGA